MDNNRSAEYPQGHSNKSAQSVERHSDAAYQRNVLVSTVHNRKRRGLDSRLHFASNPLDRRNGNKWSGYVLGRSGRLIEEEPVNYNRYALDALKYVMPRFETNHEHSAVK